MELFLSIILMFGAKSIAGSEFRFMDVGLIVVFAYILLINKGKINCYKAILKLSIIKIAYTMFALIILGKFKLGYILSIGYFLEFLVVYLIANNYNFSFKKLWNIGVAIAYISALSSIILYIMGVRGRIEGLLGAQSFCYLLPFFLFTFINNVKITEDKNLKYWILMILSIAMILLSWQRTLLIVLVLSLIILYITNGGLKKFKPKTVLYGLGFLVSVAFVFHFIPQDVKTVFTARLDEVFQLALFSDSVGYRSSLTDRVVLWNAAGNIFLQHPIIGIGSGAFARLTGSEFYNYITLQLGVAFSVEGLSTHNQLLENLCETGIIGTIITYCLCITVIDKIRKKGIESNTPYYKAILVSLITLTIFDVLGQSTFYPFYNYIVLMCVSYISNVSLDSYESIAKDKL